MKEFFQQWTGAILTTMVLLSVVACTAHVDGKRAGYKKCEISITKD